MSEPGEPQHERRRSGIFWLDLVIAVTALLISSTSLIVAIVHSRTLERMADANARLVEANSWPFLSYGTGNGNEINMSVINDGIGPAKIEAIEVRWRSHGEHNAFDFLKDCCDFKPGTGNVEYELISGRVLRAGQALNLLKLTRTTDDGAAMSTLNKARLSPDLSINVCYCSVFDECWTEDIVRFTLRPKSVDRCEQPRVPYTVAH